MSRLNDATAREWDKIAAAMAKDIQVGGDHYRQGSIQPIEFIMANDLGFVEGCVVKYVTRHKRKGGKEDIKKAIHYLEILLEDYLAYEDSEKKYEEENGIY